jgi:hypothetical protein
LHPDLLDVSLEIDPFLRRPFFKLPDGSYKQATLARKLQNIIGRPSARDYLRIVENNLLKDCPIVGTDVMATEDVFGPNVGSLKEKTVRHGGTQVNPEYLQVPSPNSKWRMAVSHQSNSELVIKSDLFGIYGHAFLRPWTSPLLNEHGRPGLRASFQHLSYYLLSYTILQLGEFCPAHYIQFGETNASTSALKMKLPRQVSTAKGGAW